MQHFVADSWRRIEQWLLVNAPLDANFLASGATENQIVEAEEILGVRLPDDVRQSYLPHNGALEFNSLRVFEYGEFLSPERMVEDWSVWKGVYDHDEGFRYSEGTPDVGVKIRGGDMAGFPFVLMVAVTRCALTLSP